MKTKAESNPEKSKKKSGTANRKTIVFRSQPSEEEVRELAEILYHQRVDRGEHGTQDGDWLAAEAYLSNV